MLLKGGTYESKAAMSQTHELCPSSTSRGCCTNPVNSGSQMSTLVSSETLATRCHPFSSRKQATPNTEDWCPANIATHSCPLKTPVVLCWTFLLQKRFCLERAWLLLSWVEEYALVETRRRQKRRRSPSQKLSGLREY